MKVGDLVRCISNVSTVDSGVGLVIQMQEFDEDGISIHVQWARDSLWYEAKELEVVQ